MLEIVVVDEAEGPEHDDRFSGGKGWKVILIHHVYV